MSWAWVVISNCAARDKVNVGSPIYWIFVGNIPDALASMS